MSDLVAKIGVGAASLYAAFGNKEQLFKATVERYAATFSVVLYGPINDPSLTTREAVEGLFERAAQLFSEPETPAGCFMFSAAAAVSPSSAAIEELLRVKRAEAEARLAERIAEGVKNGELGSDVDPVVLARFLNSVLQGMSVQARDGATHAELLGIASMALTVWPARTV